MEAAVIALFIGTFCIAGWLANLLGKAKMRREPPVQAPVAEVEQSEWRTASTGESPGSTSWVVKTRFDVADKGLLTHTRHFGTRSDAEAWTARFSTGSWHAVAPHPYSPGEVFLQEELQSQSPALLIVGLFAYAIAAAAIAWG